MPSSGNSNGKLECAQQPDHKKQLTGIKKWLLDNLLLLLTLAGVVVGVIIVYRTCFECIKTWNFQCLNEESCWHFTQIFTPLNEAWYCYKCKPSELTTNEPTETDFELDDIKYFFEDFFMYQSKEELRYRKLEDRNTSSILSSSSEPVYSPHAITAVNRLSKTSNSINEVAIEQQVGAQKLDTPKPYFRPSKKKFVCKDYTGSPDHLSGCESCRSEVEWRKTRLERQKVHLERMKMKNNIHNLGYEQRRFIGWCLMNGFGNQKFRENNPDISLQSNKSLERRSAKAPLNRSYRDLYHDSFGLRPLHPSKTAIILISYPGELFMRVLKLIIVPLIISSLVAGSASLNARLNGKIAVRTLTCFLITSVINAILGVILVVLIHPGDPGLKSSDVGGIGIKRSGSVLDNLLDLGRNIVADNIFQATFQQAHTEYVNTTVRIYNEHTGIFDQVEVSEPTLKYRAGINTLGIVVFCLAFGTILGTLGTKSKVVVDFFAVIFEVVMKMVTGVIWLTPFGIASVIAGKILSVSNVTKVMFQLGWFVITMILGVFLYQLIVLQLIYFVFVRRNPFTFYVGLVQGAVTAFATASTAAALPVTFTLMEDRLKVDARITRFVLPIGCNINMDGTAMFIAVATIFQAQINNITFDLGELVTVCFIATACSFSSASVPSAAMVLLVMVLTAMEIPDQDVFLLFAIDWLVFRTTNNMLGDCYTAAVVEQLSKKELMACDAIQSEECNSNRNMEPSEVIVESFKNGPTRL